MLVVGPALVRTIQCGDDLMDVRADTAELRKEADKDAGLRGIVTIGCAADASRGCFQLQPQVFSTLCWFIDSCRLQPCGIA